MTRNGDRQNDPLVCLVGMSSNPRQLGPLEVLTIGMLSKIGVGG